VLLPRWLGRRRSGGGSRLQQVHRTSIPGKPREQGIAAAATATSPTTPTINMAQIAWRWRRLNRTTLYRRREGVWILCSV
jgi:hypothetical protein